MQTTSKLSGEAQGSRGMTLTPASTPASHQASHPASHSEIPTSAPSSEIGPLEKAVQELPDTKPIWTEQIATYYVEQYGEHAINRLTAERAELMPDDCVLDIGCGSGSAIRAAARFATEGDLIGVDPTPAMVRFSQNESADHPDFARMRFLLGGAEALPLPDNRVTVCWAINSLHHWQDMAQGLAETRRVLADKGRFIVVEEIFEDGHGLTVAEVQKLLIAAGFDVVSTTVQEADGAQMNVLVANNNPANNNPTCNTPTHNNVMYNNKED